MFPLLYYEVNNSNLIAKNGDRQEGERLESTKVQSWEHEQLMNLRTQKIRMYRSVMAQKIRTNPEARDIENRYRLIRSVLKEVYPNLIESTSKETMLEFIKDAIWMDREARLHNEGNQTELKDQLTQEKLVELHS